MSNDTQAKCPTCQGKDPDCDWEPDDRTAKAFQARIAELTSEISDYSRAIIEYRQWLTDETAERAKWYACATKYTKERDEAMAEVERLRAALEFYANPKNWRSTHGNGGGVDDTIIDDCEGGWGAGSRARKALKGES